MHAPLAVLLTIALTLFVPTLSAQTKTPSLNHDHLEGVAQQNPNLASPACQACRNNCVNRREQCKSWACSHAGGTNKGVQCDTAGNKNWNQQRFENELKACTDQERTCWATCDKGACR